MTMDTDDALAHRLAHDLDGTFEALVLAHQDRLYTIAHRFLGNGHDAEEVTQDALVRAYQALAGYDDARIRALRLRPWLATIVLNLCRNRATGRIRRRTPCHSTPSPRMGRRFPNLPPIRPDRRRPWFERQRSPPPVGRPGHPVATRLPGPDRPPPRRWAVLPRACHCPRSPEGTVKAQVHRGLALLRTAFEASERLEREEMTA
jgi:RNA polymerase sigma factor (sigma-70 family)